MMRGLLDLGRRLFCRHDYGTPRTTYAGAWHRVAMPHPVFPEIKIHCERQDFLAAAICQKCGKRKIVPGYNTRDQDRN